MLFIFVENWHRKIRTLKVLPFGFEWLNQNRGWLVGWLFAKAPGPNLRTFNQLRVDIVQALKHTNAVENILISTCIFLVRLKSGGGICIEGHPRRRQPVSRAFSHHKMLLSKKGWVISWVLWAHLGHRWRMPTRNNPVGCSNIAH